MVCGSDFWELNIDKELRQIDQYFFGIYIIHKAVVHVCVENSFFKKFKQ